MRTKLSVVGNGLGIVIEKQILDLLNIDRDTEFEMKVDGSRLVLEPVRNDDKTEVVQAAEKIMKTYAETFKKLAK